MLLFWEIDKRIRLKITRSAKVTRRIRLYHHYLPPYHSSLILVSSLPGGSKGLFLYQSKFSWAFHRYFKSFLRQKLSEWRQHLFWIYSKAITGYGVNWLKVFVKCKFWRMRTTIKIIDAMVASLLLSTLKVVLLQCWS